LEAMLFNRLGDERRHNFRLRDVDDVAAGSFGDCRASARRHFAVLLRIT
jgi:hypothetical protein